MAENMQVLQDRSSDVAEKMNFDVIYVGSIILKTSGRYSAEMN